MSDEEDRAAYIEKKRNKEFERKIEEHSRYSRNVIASFIGLATPLTIGLLWSPISAAVSAAAPLVFPVILVGAAATVLLMSCKPEWFPRKTIVKTTRCKHLSKTNPRKQLHKHHL